MYYSNLALINFIKRHLEKWRSSFLGFRKQLVWSGPRENALLVCKDTRKDKSLGDNVFYVNFSGLFLWIGDEQDE